MLKQDKINIRFILIAGAMMLMLLLSGCTQNAPFGSGGPAGTEKTAAVTVATSDTAMPTPTPSPTVTIAPTPTAAPTPTPTPAPTLPPVPKNFIVEDEYWDFALSVHGPDGGRYKYGVGFSGFPVKLKLYAPMSGYLTVIRGDNPYPHATVYISEVADDVTEWGRFGPKTGRHIKFHAEEIELLDVEVRDDALYVEKGKPFAEVTKKAEVFPDWFEEKIELMVYFQKEWADMLDVSIGDPKEYAWSAIQIYEREVGN